MHHAAIDFERQSIGEVLAAVGFDAARPSVWIWEGVTMYLSRAAVDATLDAVAELSASGSRLAMTYVTPDFARGWIRAVAAIGARVINESLVARLDPDDLGDALDQRGFDVESDDSAIEWAARHWPERDASRVRAYERLAIARRR